MKKKICYVLPYYGKSDATHFSYIHGFLKSVSEKLNVYLLVERGDKPEGEIGAKKIVKVWMSFFPLRAIEMFFRLLSIRGQGYKNVYVHYSFLAAYLASILGMKVWYWNCGEPWKYKRSSIREQFERKTYKKITYLVTGTESLKKRYAKEYGLPLSKVKVMPNWIDTGAYKDTLDEKEIERLRKRLGIEIDRRILLFVHRLSKRKGAHYLPQILEGLKDKNVVLLVIGDGPERDRIEEDIKKRGLWSNVRFLGALPNNAIAPYYMLSDVFLMPSDEEGFPHVLLEAMVTGTPFVATNVGGVEDMLHSSTKALVVPQGDMDQFVRRVEEVLSQSPADIQKLEKVLKRWVGRYDQEKVRDIFTSLF